VLRTPADMLGKKMAISVGATGATYSRTSTSSCRSTKRSADAGSAGQIAQAVTRRVWERMLADNPDIKPPAEGLHWCDV